MESTSASRQQQLPSDRKDPPPFIPSNFPTNVGVSAFSTTGSYVSHEIAAKNLEAMKWFADVPLKPAGKLAGALKKAVSPLIGPPRTKPAPFAGLPIELDQKGHSYDDLARQMTNREFAHVRISMPGGVGAKSRVKNMLVRNDAVDSKDSKDSKLTGSLLVSLDGKNFEPLMIDPVSNQLVPLSEWVKKYDFAPASGAQPKPSATALHDTKHSGSPREAGVANSTYSEFTYDHTPDAQNLLRLMANRTGAYVRFPVADGNGNKTIYKRCYLNKETIEDKSGSDKFKLWLSENENDRTSTELTPENCQIQLLTQVSAGRRETKDHSSGDGSVAFSPQSNISGSPDFGQPSGMSSSSSSSSLP